MEAGTKIPPRLGRLELGTLELKSTTRRGLGEVDVVLEGQFPPRFGDDSPSSPASMRISMIRLDGFAERFWFKKRYRVTLEEIE